MQYYNVTQEEIEKQIFKMFVDIRAGKYFDASVLQLRQICVLVEEFLKKPSHK